MGMERVVSEDSENGRQTVNPVTPEKILGQIKNLILEEYPTKEQEELCKLFEDKIRFLKGNLSNQVFILPNGRATDWNPIHELSWYDNPTPKYQDRELSLARFLQAAGLSVWTINAAEDADKMNSDHARPGMSEKTYEIPALDPFVITNTYTRPISPNKTAVFSQNTIYQFGFRELSVDSPITQDVLAEYNPGRAGQTYREVGVLRLSQGPESLESIE